MVPGRELLDWCTNRGGVDRVEFVGQPDFEACQMFIALREQSVVLQQAAQMINMSAGPCSGEAAVGQWYCAGGDSAEQLQYLGVAFPGQDAFGSVDATEYFDQCLHGGEVRGLVQQDFAQVLAKGAAGALARAVDLAFAMAGFASEVAGDTGAAQANRSRVSAILAAREDAFVSASGADAVGTHRGVEAAVAELISGPVDAQLVGHSVASATFEGSGGNAWSPAGGGPRVGVNRCHR